MSHESRKSTLRRHEEPFYTTHSPNEDFSTRSARMLLFQTFSSHHLTWALRTFEINDFLCTILIYINKPLKSTVSLRKQGNQRMCVFLTKLHWKSFLVLINNVLTLFYIWIPTRVMTWQSSRNNEINNHKRTSLQFDQETSYGTMFAFCDLALGYPRSISVAEEV